MAVKALNRRHLVRRCAILLEVIAYAGSYLRHAAVGQLKMANIVSAGTE